MNAAANLPPPANKIITYFVNELSCIEPNSFEGVYITGSLSMNDFHPAKSDIDFLVLCKTLPDQQTTSQLQKVHNKLHKLYSKPDLSGVYLSSNSIQTQTPQNIQALHYHQGTIKYAAFEMGPISLAELKSHAITITGQSAQILPININKEDIKNFLHHNIISYWTNWLKQHSSFLNRKTLLVLFPRLTEWVILGVARQLYTLQTGNITSKTAAGYYCLQHLPNKYHPIIQQAIEIRKDNRKHFLTFKSSYYVQLSLKRCVATIDCANHIINLFNQHYNKLKEI